ncbi:MAG: T9SS type A sorting domain-containing protein [Cyclobacteriaceae bacterium]
MKIRLTPVLILLAGASFAQTPFKAGVNFPFYTPGRVSIYQYLDLIHQSKAKAIRQMTFADIHWKQVEPTDNNWQFTRPDSAFNNPYNLVPVGTLYSMMGDDENGMQTPWLACSDPFTCFWDPAGDSIYAKDYVFQTVNRYKAKTKYWEVANEIEHTLPPEGLPSLLAQYNFLKYNYRWLKQADPQAKVLLPGLLGTCCSYPMSNSFTWLRNLLNIGGGNYFDIMNYHDYNAWWTLPAHYDSVKNILTQYGLNKPIWVTETAVSSVNTSPITPTYSSVDQQAADVWRRLCLLWAKGAEVVFWHTGWSNADFTGWGEFGIISNAGVKKKSFHSFSLLNESVANFTEVSLVSTGTVTDNNTSGGNGVWVIRFVVDGSNKWVIWSPNSQPYTLNGLSTSYINVTKVVPTTVSGDGQSATFEEHNYPVSSGSYTFTSLSSIPLLVEETTITAVNRTEPLTQIQVYPNPTNGQVTIGYGREFSGRIAVDIYDELGRLVHSNDFIPANPDQGVNISLADQPRGIYICKIRLGNRVVVRRISKI